MSVRAGVAYVDVVPNMDKFGSQVSSGITSSTRSLGSKLLSFGKVASIGLGAVAVAAGAAFHAFEEAEQVAHQTDAVLKSTGNAANVTATQVAGLAGRLSMLAGVDDEMIQTGENMLLTFTNVRNEVGKGNDVFNQATKTALDMSVALGTDIKSSAMQLGKALNDPVKGIAALTRVGVAFTEEQKAQVAQLIKHNNVLGAQKLILAEVTKEFGGSAEAQATASGKMGVAVGNLVEKIGGLLAPVITQLVDGLTAFVLYATENVGPMLQDAGVWFQGVWDKIGPVVTMVGQDLLNAFKAVWDALSKNILPALQQLWTALKPVLKVVGLVVGVVLVLALKALPAVIRVIGVLISWNIKLAAAFLSIIGAVGTMVGKVVNWFQGMWQKLQEIGHTIAHFFGEIWNGIKAVAGAAWDGIVAGARIMANGIIEVLNILISGINRVHDAMALANPFGGAGWDRIAPIPSLAEGGVVRQQTLAMIGEAGPEAVSELHEWCASR